MSKYVEFARKAMQEAQETGHLDPIVEAIDSAVKEKDAEIEHLKSNHEDLVKRNAFLRERPDLPKDRIPQAKRYEVEISDLKKDINRLNFLNNELNIGRQIQFNEDDIKSQEISSLKQKITEQQKHIIVIAQLKADQRVRADRFEKALREIKYSREVALWLFVHDAVWKIADNALNEAVK